jgi:hypothetical protein
MAMTKSIEALVPVILAKTDEGKLRWKAETANLFVADIGKDKVITVSKNTANDYRLDLRRADGVLLDGISSGASFGVFDVTPAQIRDIFDLARRQALKIDEALEDASETLLRM